MASKTMATLVLWSYPLSFNVHKARLALEEKRIPYKTRNVNILTGENLGADYLKINPNGTVPALQENEKLITDSTDIVIYVDNIGTPLGDDKVDREKVTSWLNKVSFWNDTLYTLGNQDTATALFFTDFKIKVAEKRLQESPQLKSLLDKRIQVFKQLKENFQSQEIVSAETEKLQSMLDDADKELKDSEYLAGSEFSMADVVLMTVLARVEMVGKTKELVSTRPALQAYWKRMKSRESYKKVIGKYAGLGALPHLIPTLVNMKLRSAFHYY